MRLSKRGDGVKRVRAVDVAVPVAAPVTVAVHVTHVTVAVHVAHEVAVATLVGLGAAVGISFPLGAGVMVQVLVGLGLLTGVSAPLSSGAKVGVLVKMGIKGGVSVSTGPHVAVSVGSASAGRVKVGKAVRVGVPTCAASKPAKVISDESPLAAIIPHLWGGNGALGELPICKNVISLATSLLLLNEIQV